MATKKKYDRQVAAKHRERLGLPSKMEEAKALLATRQDRMFSAILDCIQQGSYIETACMVAGISKQRFYQWCKKGNAGEEPYASFLEDLRKAQGESIMANLSVIDLAAARGDWRAAAWRLKTMYPSLYGDRVEVTTRKDYDPGQPVEPGASGAVDLSGLTLAEKKQLRDLMQKASKPEKIIEAEIVE